MTILLVEDDRLDAKIVRRAFAENHICKSLNVVSHGEEALAFLRKQGEYADARTPDLILLDLNMPVMNGIEFLEAYRRDTAINITPVVVLTTSVDDKDTLAAYQHGVGGYLKKPVAFQEFLRVIETLDAYWSMCVFPPTGDGKRDGRA